MAKRLYTKATNVHKECSNCREIDYEFLSLKGLPILGECEYKEERFLLNEAIECKNYKKR